MRSDLEQGRSHFHGEAFLDVVGTHRSVVVAGKPVVADRGVQQGVSGVVGPWAAGDAVAIRSPVTQ